MIPHSQTKSLHEHRKSALVTLALAALIHETTAAVQETALTLMERYPERLGKSLLKPLSQSPHALDHVVDEVIYPVQEKILGIVRRDNYEYEIAVSYRGYLDYTTAQISDLVAARFVQRGIVTGRIYITMDHPHYKHLHHTSVDLAEFSRYSRVQNG